MPAAQEPDYLAAARRAEAGAWENLIRRYGRLVYSIPLSFGLSEHDAADIAQTTFSELVAQIDRISDGTRLAGWLATVARRHTWRRAQAARRTIAVSAVPDHVAEEDLHDRTADLVWLDAGLAQLDERCRSLITAMFLTGEEPTYAELSNRFAIPIGSIGPTRQRCLEQLRRILGDAT